MAEDGSLRVWDFSTVRFTNESGRQLPRRQRLLINGMRARDAGDEIVLEVPGNAAAANGLLVSILGQTEILVGDEGAVRFCTGGDAVGDGKGGLFYADYGNVTTPVRAGTVIRAANNTGTWIRISPNTRSVLVKWEPGAAADVIAESLMGGRRGAHDNEIIQVAGYYTTGNGYTGLNGFGDNGGGLWIWKETGAEATYTPNGGTVVCKGTIAAHPSTGLGRYVPDPATVALPGRWLRLNVKDTISSFNVKAFGALLLNVPNLNPSNYIADVYAFEAMRDASRPQGAVHRIPEGKLALSVTTGYYGAISGTSSQSNVHLKGDSAQGQTFNNSWIVWHGASYWNGATPAAPPEPAAVANTGSVMFNFSNYDSCIEGIQFATHTAFHCGVLLNIGPNVGAASPVSITHQRVQNCGFSGSSATLGSASSDIGICFDYFCEQHGNIENCEIDDCTFTNIRANDIRISQECQPYNTTINRLYRLSNLHSTSPGIGPYGVVINNQNASCSMHISNGDFQRASCFILHNNPFQSLTITECSAEQYKKLHKGMESTEQAMGLISQRGGRLDPGGLTYAGEGPDSTYLDYDYYAIDIGTSQPIRLESLCINRGFLEFTTFFFRWRSNTLYVVNCDLPHIAPFEPGGEVTPAILQGGVWCEGCTSPGITGTAAAGKRVRMPKLNGCRTPGGTVTFSGAATSPGAITNRHPDGVTAWPEAVGSTGWKVRWIGVTAITGAPVAGLPYATAITKDGFTPNVTVAPGVGNTITWAYENYRD